MEVVEDAVSGATGISTVFPHSASETISPGDTAEEDTEEGS